MGVCGTHNVPRAGDWLHVLCDLDAGGDPGGVGQGPLVLLVGVTVELHEAGVDEALAHGALDVSLDWSQHEYLDQIDAFKQKKDALRLPAPKFCRRHEPRRLN